ncbi:MAG: polysaccharide biosynthesis C-terminal domain-containing protein [Clostridia bacterium]|nr:polysaccharide biosynthesis C-terminal domain-containing protein [Clostridia bacterium]
MNNRRQYQVGTVLSYVIILFNIASGLVFVPILARFMGPEYNLYEGIGAFAGYIAMMDFGLGTVVIRYVAKYRAEGDRAGMERFLGMVLSLYTCIGALIVALGVAGFSFLGSFFTNLSPDELEVAQKLFVVLIANSACSMLFNVFPGVLAAHERFVPARVISLVRIIVRVGLVLIVVTTGGGAVRIMLVDTALNVASMVASALYAMVTLKVRIRWRGFESTLLRQIFSFSIFVFLNMVMNEAYWRLDRIIMMRVAFPLVIVTSTGGKMAEYLMEFSNVFSGLFLPRAVQIVTRGADKAELTSLMIRVGRLQLMVISLLVIGFAVVGRQFMELWVGSVPALSGRVNECYAIALMLMLALLVPLFQSSGISILQALNKHAFRAVMLFFIAILKAVMSVFLAIAYGPIGAAAGTVVSLIIGNILISNWYYHYRIGLNIPCFFREGLRGILPALLLITGISCLTFFMPQDSWRSLLARIGVIFPVYVGVMITVGMNASERAMLRDVVDGVWRRFKRGNA